MERKVLTFSERLAAMVFWVTIAIILLGLVLHLASKYGVLPSVVSKISALTNIQAQAGG